MSFGGLSTDFAVTSTFGDAQKVAWPTGTAPGSISDPNSLSGNINVYPIVQWTRFTCWPFQYDDNRVSYCMVITVTEPRGGFRIVKTFEAPGARYIWKIDVDSANKQVHFVGQSSQEVVLSYLDLAENTLGLE